MPSISVIVPVYNTQKYLNRCVDSILNQTFTDFELILVDDGSTDGSGAICDEYAAHDERVKVIHKSNGGVNSAVIAGVNAAACEFTVFSDSDDELHTDCLEFLYKEITSKNLDAVQTVIEIRNLDGTISIEWNVNTKVYDKDEIRSQILQPYFEGGPHDKFIWCNGRCGKLYKTALLKGIIANQCPSLSMGEDLALNLEYLFLCNRVEMIGDYHVYIYIIHGDSLSHKSDINFIDRYILLHNELKKIACKNNMRSNLQCRMDNMAFGLLTDLALGKYNTRQRIAQAKKAYNAIENKNIIRDRAGSLYFAFRPGMKLIANGHVTFGVIVTSLTNTAVTFAAKIFKKQIERKNAANNGEQP